MKTIRDFTDHLRHCIQEAEGVKLSEKSVRDIQQTLLGCVRVSTKGTILNMEEWRHKYFEIKRRHGE